MRYERTLRDYTVGAAKDGEGKHNRNFGRNDDIQQYQTWLTFPLPVLAGLSLGVRYRFREGVFDQPEREPKKETFDVHEIGLEVSYAF